MIKRGPKPNHEAQAAKYGKNCKACGTWFVNRDRYYCSTECRKSVVAKPVEFTCQHCGKRGTRDPHGIKNINRMFCNKECQNAFQKSSYQDYQNLSSKPISEARAVIARSKWYTSRRKERRENSVSGDWWAKCVKCSSTIIRVSKMSGWDRRCTSAASMIKRRREPVFKLEAIRVATWGKTIAKNKKRLRVDNRTKEQIEWSNKIHHTTRMCKRRFLVKSKSDTGRFGMSIMETQQRWLPFAE